VFEVIKIYLKMKEQYIKTEMEYTFNFWMMLISGVLTRLLAMAVPFVIYGSLPDIAGWKENEIYLIMALLSVSDGACSVFFEGIWRIPEMVFHGELDNVLARPISPLFQILSYGLGLQGLAVLSFGIVMMFVCIASLGRFNPGTLALCALFVVCGTAICMSIYLIGNSLAFWFDTGGRTTLPYAIVKLGDYAKYPAGIYPLFVRFILMFLIPFSFIGEIPVRILRGESTLMYGAGLVAVSAVFVAASRAFFYRGIRKYESMGM
jgi:ABC-type uncharacterized transport system, permease component